jgi:hypothetical protein
MPLPSFANVFQRWGINVLHVHLAKHPRHNLLVLFGARVFGEAAELQRRYVIDHPRRVSDFTSGPKGS